MKKNKTAIILTIVSILLWAVFLIIRLSILPKEAHLSYQIDGWLLVLSSVLTSVSAAFWLAALARKWNIPGKIIVWCLYGVTSLFWMLVIAFISSYFGLLFSNRYACSNDKNYVMRRYFDIYTILLYQKQGLVETNVCFLGHYYYPFDDPKLFVYENADAIVVQHSENDSVYTDVYHFNGDIYEGSAKDSILDVVKVVE
jgi:hypothetical protein